MGKLGGQFFGELARVKSPCPGAAMQAGGMHTGLATQTKDVLQRGDAQGGHRRLSCTNKRPMNSVVTLAYVGEGVAALVLSGAGTPPARGSVVVMRAGI